MDCLICDNRHDTSCCDYPASVVRCHNCHLLILSGEQHVCSNNNNISGYRLDVLAEEAIAKFKLRLKNQFDNNGAELFFFSEGRFNVLDGTSKLLSPATSGIFTVQPSESYNIINYDATKAVRFSF